MKRNKGGKVVIAIVIPVHNGIRFTKNCLNSLVPDTSSLYKTRYKYEIVVTDDGSVDGTSSWIKENHPSVHIQPGNGNLWWSGGINRGVSYAFDNLKASYIIWWNNDIHPADNYFSSAANLIEKYGNRTILGSKIFVYNNNKMLWGMGGRFDPVKGTRYMYGERRQDCEDFEKPYEVDWFPGMGTIIHKSVFEKTGMLDEKNFPQYHGDSDFTFRAKKAGFRLVAHPELVIYNDISNTGLKHSGKFSELFSSLTSIRSNYNIGKDIAFYRKHSNIIIAAVPLFNKYFRYIGGFYKWKLLNFFGIRKKVNKSKIRAYIYPVTSRLKTGIYNPYLDNFMESTCSFIDFRNKKSPSSTGILNILRFIGRIDAVYLNWIENLPDKMGGRIQTYFFLRLLKLKKILKFRVVWTLHNKISHTSVNFPLKEKIFREMLKSSDLVITHSREGVTFAETYLPGSSSRVFYFPHPVDSATRSQVIEKRYDLLIWGTITSYKGVDSFLEYLRDNGLLDRYRIMIAGKVMEKSFSENIKKYESAKITIDDRFISKEELSELISSSMTVLFTYSSDSVLSSGALMDSIACKAVVVGPHKGAFADMREIGIIETYEHFSEIPVILERMKMIDKIDLEKKIENFISTHTWKEFSLSLSDRMNSFM